MTPRGSKPSHTPPTVSGTVRDLGYGGDGAVETEHGIVLVPGALPGEAVRIALTGRRRGVQRGRLVSVVASAPDRVAPTCRLQARCGGCPLMIWSDAAQQEQKRAWVAAAVTAGVAEGKTPPGIGIAAGSDSLGYRRRARLHFHVTGVRRSMGYQEPRSNRVLDVAGCPVLSEPLAQALGVVRARLLPELAANGEVELGLGAAGKVVLHLMCEEPQPASVYACLRALVAEDRLAGASLRLTGGPTEERIGDPRAYFPAVMEGEVPLWGATGGFGQANDSVNRELVAWVVEAAAPQALNVLELYAGHGNFTVPLARTAASLTAIEHHREAAEACRANLAAAGIRTAKVVAAEVRPLPKRLGRGRVDVVVLDPPRTGAREVIPDIVGLRPGTIVYVSCDPPTLRRDLATLLQSGYAVDRAQGFDMFPHTAHVETAVRLRPA